MKKQIVTGVAVILASVFFSTAHAEIDADAAKKLAKQNDCFKCHAEKKSKKGPAYNKIALKYKGKADAEAALIKQITTGPTVKLDDGTEEKHKIIDTKDQGQMKNLIGWILSL